MQQHRSLAGILALGLSLAIATAVPDPWTLNDFPKFNLPGQSAAIEPLRDLLRLHLHPTYGAFVTFVKPVFEEDVEEFGEDGATLVHKVKTAGWR